MGTLTTNTIMLLHTIIFLFSCPILIQANGYTKALLCSKGENFQLFCGRRYKGTIYDDRCRLGEKDRNIMAIEKCPNHTDYECFIDVIYPEIEESYMESMYPGLSWDIDENQPEFEGIAVQAVTAGCRLRDDKVKAEKMEESLANEQCFGPAEKSVLGTYSCGCHNVEQILENSKINPGEYIPCNSIFYVPRKLLMEKHKKLRKMKLAIKDEL